MSDKNLCVACVMVKKKSPFVPGVSLLVANDQSYPSCVMCDNCEWLVLVWMVLCYALGKINKHTVK